ncbi:MAG: putative dehydrogenase [Candidatus Azotimanducaceae bacterium]|jgi:predicted dehydrogenase
MKKVRVGILGCAEIARRYAIPAFKALPDVELVAIASRSKEKADACASEHGLEAEGYESLIARPDIDVIYSPLPVGLQEEWTLKSAAAGKHVMCEKSITYSLESAKKMVQACKEANVALYENFALEFHPQHAKILSLIEEGHIGTPRVWNGAFAFPPFEVGNIRNNPELRGGAINDCGCYTAFMARKIMQAEPIAVTCRISSESKDVDIAGSALFEFAHGEALMSFGFDHLYQNTYSVLGSKGMLQTKRAFAIPPTLEPPVVHITNNGKEDKTENLVVPAANQFELSFDFFFKAIAKNDSVQFEDMYERILAQATVLEAMRTSAKEGKRVLL